MKAHFERESHFRNVINPFLKKLQPAKNIQKVSRLFVGAKFNRLVVSNPEFFPFKFYLSKQWSIIIHNQNGVQQKMPNETGFFLPLCKKGEKQHVRKSLLFCVLPDKICKLTSVASSYQVFFSCQKNQPRNRALHIVMPCLVISMHYGNTDAWWII